MLWLPFLGSASLEQPLPSCPQARWTMMDSASLPPSYPAAKNAMWENEERPFPMETLWQGPLLPQPPILLRPKSLCPSSCASFWRCLPKPL